MIRPIAPAPHRHRVALTATALATTTLAIAGLVAVGLIAAPASGAAAAAEEPPKVERLAIVDRAIEEHGGDLYRASETELDICSRSGCFHLRARIDGGLYEYEVQGKVGDSVRRVVASNDRVERWEDGKPVKLHAAEAQKARDFANARIYFPFLPYRLNDPGVYKQDQGLERWGERDLHRVKVTFAAGSSTDADDEYLFWFDPQSGRLEQLAYSFHGRPGGLRFRTAHDFRRVGGLLFSDQTNLGIDQDGLRVDQITPAFVAERMQPISEVELRNIEVRPLAAEGDGSP